MSEPDQGLRASWLELVGPIEYASLVREFDALRERLRTAEERATKAEERCAALEAGLNADDEAALLTRLGVPELRAENERLKALLAKDPDAIKEPWKDMDEAALRLAYAEALRHCWQINAEMSAIEDAIGECVTEEEWRDRDIPDVIRFLGQRRTALEHDK